MENLANIPEVAVRHSGTESSAFGRLVLNKDDLVIADRYIIQQAGNVLAERGWDYRQESTEPTPLYTDFHEPSFTYRALLGRNRYEYVEHTTEGHETLDHKDLYSATVTLSNRQNMGRAVLKIVRGDWEKFVINLRQADTRQALATAEELPLDYPIALDLLSEIMHLSDDDPATAQELYSLEDILSVLNHRAARSESTRTLKQDTLKTEYGLASVAIEETLRQRADSKPTVTYQVGVHSELHVQRDPTVTLATDLQYEPLPEPPYVAAEVRTRLQLPDTKFWSPARRESVLRQASRKYMDPDEFIESMHAQMELVLATAKKR